VKLSGGVPVVVPTDTDFKITPAQLEAAITPKNKMMWFSTLAILQDRFMAVRSLLLLQQKHPNVCVADGDLRAH
jgi:aspartate aminotransferase